MLPYIIGAGVVGALGWFGWNKWHTDPANLPPIIVDQGITDPTTGKTIVTLADETQAFTNVQAASTAPDAAKALYTYIKANGYDQTADFHTLVEEFQNAANTVVLGTFNLYGKLPTDGVFDVTTASALGQITDDPLIPDPNAPLRAAVTYPTPVDVNQASLSQSAAWLLMRYIQLNGDTPTDPGEVTRTMIYQQAFNRDPMAPGPGWAMSASRVGLTAKLAEDGVLGPATKAVLYKSESQSDFNSTGGRIVAPTSA